jgi:hypothetical protein
LARAFRDDPESIIWQRRLNVEASIGGACNHTSHSASVVKMTGIAFRCRRAKPAASLQVPFANAIVAFPPFQIDVQMTGMEAVRAGTEHSHETPAGRGFHCGEEFAPSAVQRVDIEADQPFWQTSIQATFDPQRRALPKPKNRLDFARKQSIACLCDGPREQVRVR